MSGHERDRLSGYLDGELSAAERGEVDTHLRTCPECSALLADMEEVDGQARGLGVEGPEGYFDTFAGRVRSRIEATPRRTRAPGPRRLPRWTWAAAAGLILGVLTPLTLREMTTSHAPPAAPAPPAPFPPEPDSPVSAPRTPAAFDDRLAPRTDAVSGAEADRERPRHLRKGEQKAVARDQERAPEPPPAAGAAPRAAAPPATAPPTGADPAGGRAARARAPEDRGAALEKDVRPSGAGRPGAEVESQVLEERAALETGEAGFASEPAVGTALAAPVAAAEPSDSSPVAAAAAGERRRLFPPDVRIEIEAKRAFDDLVRQDLEPGDDAETWRGRREAWRDYAHEYPRSRHADEARVRAIEAGVEAWRAGRAPGDLAQVRQDAAAYLARDDATLTQRVQHALDSVSE